MNANEMRNGRDSNVLGVLGGMGPLASAEFVKTIYEYSGDCHQQDQESPSVVLYSDPGFPDRTEALLRGEDDVLLEALAASLERLRAQGASRIVICCMTVHHLLPRLPPDLREQIIPLTDVLFARVELLRKKQLVICSSGTRKLGLLEAHARWEQAKDYLLFPGEAEQQKLHARIYEVKRNRGLRSLLSFIESLLTAYQVDSFVAACTELHLLAKLVTNGRSEQREYECIDPLSIIAKQVAGWNTHES
jgi:aspartate racemase